MASATKLFAYGIIAGAFALGMLHVHAWNVVPAQKAAARLRVGHDGLEVDRAVKRHSGIVTALDKPNSEGHIYSFRAAPLPAASGYVPNELRGWRLTVLAGERFASVFEVQSNTESQITVTPMHGPLNGLAVRDVFVVEQIAIDRQQPGGAARKNQAL